MQLKNDNISQALQNAEQSSATAGISGVHPAQPSRGPGEVPPLPPRLKTRTAPQTPPKPTNLQSPECELSVYKSVPAPRQLSAATDHPLSGSEPTLSDLAGRLSAVPTSLTSVSVAEDWQSGPGAASSAPALTPGTGSDPATAANGRLTKKYHHLRDMLSSRFSRSGDADGRGLPLSAAPEQDLGGPGDVEGVSQVSAAAAAAARGAPLRSSVRSLAAEEVAAAAGERQLWSADGPARGRVASLGARYVSAGSSQLSAAAQRPLANGSPAGDQQQQQQQQYLGYPPVSREYQPQPQSYHEPSGYRPAPASGALYSVPPRPQQRPPGAFPGSQARPAGFSGQQLRPSPPPGAQPGQPRPPPPAYGTRLPPPGHYLSRQGSQGRPPVDSAYGPGRPPPPLSSAGTATVTARPAVSSGPLPEPGSRPLDPARSQPGGEHRQTTLLDTSVDSEGRARGGQRTAQPGGDQEWADTETELRQILDPGSSRRPDVTSAPSAGQSTPPLPALAGSPPRSPLGTPRMGGRAGTRQPPGPNQPDLLEDTAAPGGQSLTSAPRSRQTQGQSRGWGVQRGAKESSPTRDARERSRLRAATRVGSLGVLGQANDSGGDLASLDLESALDQTSDQSTDDSTVLEAGVDGATVRRQLQSLETMYSEVLRLLGGQKRPAIPPGRVAARVPVGRLRAGSSISSLPSSIGGKPSRDRRRDDRKQTRDSRGINKRFQRLESHVVTLARSVAHLSSEMRTQHLMFQEMESIRSELAQLRQGSAGGPRPGGDFGAFRPANVSLTHPPRVRKLTRFFGDEPPLLRIFLNQLGYEKYAPLFERERIGMLELPYMTEDRLQKLGVPIGPRLRILHEAQLSMRADNPNVYIL